MTKAEFPFKKALGLDFITDFRKGLDLTVDWARDYFRRAEQNGG